MQLPALHSARSQLRLPLNSKQHHYLVITTFPGVRKYYSQAPPFCISPHWPNGTPLDTGKMLRRKRDQESHVSTCDTSHDKPLVTPPKLPIATRNAVEGACILKVGQHTTSILYYKYCTKTWRKQYTVQRSMETKKHVDLNF
ncbi:hypothetical protein GDO81_029825 [Engystomops pustulosus]|uniref:Uncharacterized protein n=1 Tax=Engystomops pustulosus TaxID=76066 RepID=A0AAV6Z180_ENGPU|nr:hypothetical protein GDO81_029825 [Engystomops pustulosus]